MAVIRVDPQKFESSSAVQVDSDAPSNLQAIQEIDEWAERHGFVRVSEYYLRRALQNGRRVYRGVCYRPSEDERAAAIEDIAEIDRRLDQQRPSVRRPEAATSS